MYVSIGAIVDESSMSIHLVIPLFICRVFAACQSLATVPTGSRALTRRAEWTSRGSEDDKPCAGLAQGALRTQRRVNPAGSSREVMCRPVVHQPRCRDDEEFAKWGEVGLLYHGPEVMPGQFKMLKVAQGWEPGGAP